MTGLDPERIRLRLRFDVERLRQASTRLDTVEDHLKDLRRSLQERAQSLAGQAQDTGRVGDGENDPSTISLWMAQAQAVADLASRATLQEVLWRQGRLSLVACMAISRWIDALQALSNRQVSAGAVDRHVKAGRIAHRSLRTLMPSSGMRRYCGLLTSSLVVAEFVHPDNQADVTAQIEAGIARARRGGRSDDVILEAVSAALRTGARLMGSMADRAEPKARAIAARAETVEAEIAEQLTRRTQG